MERSVGKNTFNCVISCPTHIQHGNKKGPLKLSINHIHIKIVLTVNSFFPIKIKTGSQSIQMTTNTTDMTLVLVRIKKRMPKPNVENPKKKRQNGQNKGKDGSVTKKAPIKVQILVCVGKSVSLRFFPEGFNKRERTPKH